MLAESLFLEPEEAAVALLRRAAPHMSPRSTDAVHAMPAAFEHVAMRRVESDAPVLRAMLAVDEDMAWAYATEAVCKAAARFAREKRALQLKALELLPYAGAGTCPMCMAPSPTDALPCCGQGVHRHCWVEWRLSAPRSCMLCRGAVL